MATSRAVEIEVKGLKEAKADLKALGADLTEKKSTWEPIAHGAETYGKRSIVRLTGTLRKSVEGRTKATGVKVVMGTKGKAKEYAGIHEYKQARKGRTLRDGITKYQKGPMERDVEDIFERLAKKRDLLV